MKEFENKMKKQKKRPVKDADLYLQREVRVKDEWIEERKI